MTWTCKAENRHIDDDVTIRIAVASGRQRTALDVPGDPYPHNRNALTSELRSTLRRLTAPAPSAKTQRATPQATRTTSHREARPQTTPADDRPSEPTPPPAAMLPMIRDAILRFVIKSRCRAVQLGGSISQFAARHWTEGLRTVLTGWYRAQRERWEVVRALSFARPTRWKAWLQSLPRLWLRSDAWPEQPLAEVVLTGTSDGPPRPSTVQSRSG